MASLKRPSSLRMCEQNKAPIIDWRLYGDRECPNFDFKLGKDETIKTLYIETGDLVHCLGFDIVDNKSGKTKTIRTRQNNANNINGSPGAHESIKLDLNGERITELSGILGTYIDGTEPAWAKDKGKEHVLQLRIHTDKNPTGYGPYGRGIGTSSIHEFKTHNYPPIKGPIVGFMGHQGIYLDSIGVYIQLED